jgi:multicomponent Na+:H+ antiporter subunit F
MSAAVVLDWATMIALILLAAALILTVARIVIGPTLADRILALDLLTIVAMGFIGAVAVRTRLWLYLDIALALALLGFLATVALARFIMLRSANLKEPQP